MFLDLFDKRNLAGDTQLAELVTRARMIMEGKDRGQLISDEAAREAVAKEFNGICKELDNMGVVDKPNRKIRVMD